MPPQSGENRELPQLRKPATANASAIETALDKIIKRTGVMHKKIPLLKSGNKGILKAVIPRVERNGAAANILKGERI
ncbi:hypothetical protein Cflav_PD2000 [Pedosphaera parvula Ellin514]|uniref:Uncharacterized protein n=1 Tax=Pedosphaera parvula (strain Ellin514) TaxID=320771 RepID=B9XMA9_PEDPL|nr:hypothetical protein Cflav_PD2000 [Pedosphaera parvula Ellin514]